MATEKYVARRNRWMPTTVGQGPQIQNGSARRLVRRAGRNLRRFLRGHIATVLAKFQTLARAQSTSRTTVQRDPGMLVRLLVRVEARVLLELTVRIAAPGIVEPMGDVLCFWELVADLRHCRQLWNCGNQIWDYGKLRELLARRFAKLSGRE